MVLTFDDGMRSHLVTVAPVLERYGFKATFFVTGIWADTKDHLTWEEVAGLQRQGFEIGSHTFEHVGAFRPEARVFLPGDLRRLDEALAAVGVPRPVSFAWPGGAFGPEALRVLREHGFLFGRRCVRPDFPIGTTLSGRDYDPGLNDPLLVPAYGLVNDSWSLEHFAAIIQRARSGRAVVLCFHGVPDPVNPSLSTSPERFEKMMEHLSRGGYRGIAMRDLAKWVDPAARPPDPLVARRCR